MKCQNTEEGPEAQSLPIPLCRCNLHCEEQSTNPVLREGISTVTARFQLSMTLRDIYMVFEAA